HGYEYVGTEFTKTGGTAELIVYVDKPGGIGLDDCEKISRLIEPLIDERAPIEESYCLVVSSPGLDRPLKTERDYRRSVGKMVDVKLYRAQDGKKEWTGLLLRHDGRIRRLKSMGRKRYFRTRMWPLSGCMWIYHSGGKP
ncbi:MAG: ribosome maturation factor RimP, partial [Christensenellaceae bacterium]|nr:ribosome maturation factor RimP [Christensenellaceae bacterium]